MANRFEGSSSGAGLRIAIVASRFNADITAALLRGALDTLAEKGVAPDDIDEAHVPGAFELPLIAHRMAETGRYDAVICLGAVIKGQTSHDQYIAGQAAAGIQRAAMDTGVPVVFGVITPNDREQALERAGGRINKGTEAAETAIEMATLIRAMNNGR